MTGIGDVADVEACCLWPAIACIQGEPWIGLPEIRTVLGVVQHRGHEVIKQESMLHYIVSAPWTELGHALTDVAFRN